MSSSPTLSSSMGKGLWEGVEVGWEDTPENVRLGRQVVGLDRVGHGEALSPKVPAGWALT